MVTKTYCDMCGEATTNQNNVDFRGHCKIFDICDPCLNIYPITSLAGKLGLKRENYGAVEVTIEFHQDLLPED